VVGGEVGGTVSAWLDCLGWVWGGGVVVVDVDVDVDVYVFFWVG